MRRRAETASEHDEQCALIEWWTIFAQTRRIHPSLLYAIPNGGARHAAVAAKLKAEGVRKGIPDLMLAMARGQYHGLYVEMKATGGRTTVEQKAMLDEFSKQGYCTVVALGADEARVAITEYLAQK